LYPPIVDFKLFQGEVLLLEGEYNNHMIVEADNIPGNVTKILESMKKGEICECTVKLPRLLETEKVSIPNLNKENGDLLIKVIKECLMYTIF
jgi:hypothetical protein